jgi:hypothetical protein
MADLLAIYRDTLTDTTTVPQPAEAISAAALYDEQRYAHRNGGLAHVSSVDRTTRTIVLLIAHAAPYTSLYVGDAVAFYHVGSGINYDPRVTSDARGRPINVLVEESPVPPNDGTPGLATWVDELAPIPNDMLADYSSRVGVTNITSTPSNYTNNIWNSLRVDFSGTGESHTPSTETRSDNAKELIKTFKDASLEDARKMARFGFELETQLTNGKKWSDCSVNYDEVAWKAEVLRRTEERMVDLHYVVDKLMRHSKGWFAERLHPTLRSFTASELVEELSAREGHPMRTVDDLINAGYLVHTKMRIAEYLMQYVAPYVPIENFPMAISRATLFKDLALGTDFDVVQDGSVDGFEIRTRGANEYDRVVDLAKKAFNYDHKIDERCSFHIHLSVDGIRHSYGSRLQTAMIEFLLSNLTRMPASVVQRWSKSNSYFKPKIGTEKYTFVHYHSRLRTWEFRCFGNVTNAEDAEACLNWAIKALQHGYKVLNNEVTLLKDQYDLTEDLFYHACNIASTEKRNLDEQLASGSRREAA